MARDAPALRAYLVDDQLEYTELIRLNLGLTLELVGLRADFGAATDKIEEALTRLRSETPKYDLVVTDMLWPRHGGRATEEFGQDARGYEVIREARRRGDDVVVVALSHGDRSHPRLETKAFECGADIFRFWDEDLPGREGEGWTDLAMAISTVLAMDPAERSARRRRQATFLTSEDHPMPSVAPTHVFVVHGRDDANVRARVQLLVERATNLRAITFDSEANAGRSIREKLDDLGSGSAIAVVVATADDTGGRTEGRTKPKLRPRPRQNVVLECGLFMARLGHARTIVLRPTDIEMPSDLDGVLYVDLDRDDWPNRLARELEAAGATVDHGSALTA